MPITATLKDSLSAALVEELESALRNLEHITCPTCQLRKPCFISNVLLGYTRGVISSIKLCPHFLHDFRSLSAIDEGHVSETWVHGLVNLI